MVENKGKRFSHVYLNRGAPEKDSKTARFRLSKHCEDSCPIPSSRHGGSTNYKQKAIDAIESELGIKFASKSQSGQAYQIWEWYFRRISVIEMLDTITIVANSLYSEFARFDRRKAFIERVRIIFTEENLAYQIDDNGSIHPLIDSAFSSAKASAIAVLSGTRYEATAACVDAIDKHLLQDPADYKGAIRSIFGANENLFKLMYAVPRLDAKSAGENVGKTIQSAYVGHPSLQAASTKMIESFKDWINAAHFYRHEEGVEEPNQPSEEAAILMISQGISFVRWLAQLDARKNG